MSLTNTRLQSVFDAITEDLTELRYENCLNPDLYNAYARLHNRMCDLKRKLKEVHEQNTKKTLDGINEELDYVFEDLETDLSTSGTAAVVVIDDVNGALCTLDASITALQKKMQPYQKVKDMKALREFLSERDITCRDIRNRYDSRDSLSSGFYTQHCWDMPMSFDAFADIVFAKDKYPCFCHRDGDCNNN